MTTHYRHLRTSNPTKPFPSPVDPGEIIANTANRQIAIGDADAAQLGTPLPLLAIRVFDIRAQYAASDFVIQGGNLYRAKAAISPGAFSAAQWDLYSSDTALNAPTKAYVDAGDATVTTNFQSADAAITTAYQNADNALQANIDAKVDKTYVDTQDGLAVKKAGDTMSGALNLPNGTAAAPGLAFAGQCGIYGPGSALGFTVSGTLRVTISLTGITPSVPIKGIDGTVSSPSYNFGLENSGLYRKSAANISMSVTQNEVMSWNGTTKTTTTFGPVVLPTDPVNPLEASTKQYVDAHVPVAATAAEYLANSAPSKMLTPGVVWGAAMYTTLTDGPTVTPDLSLGIDFLWTLGAAGRTLANPINVKSGQRGLIFIVPGASGTITSWGSAYKFPGGVKPTLGANETDIISYVAYAGSPPTVYCTYNGNFS
jgi:hypothetical protein